MSNDRRPARFARKPTARVRAAEPSRVAVATAPISTLLSPICPRWSGNRMLTKPSPNARGPLASRRIRASDDVSGGSNRQRLTNGDHSCRGRGYPISLLSALPLHAIEHPLLDRWHAVGDAHAGTHPFEDDAADDRLVQEASAEHLLA